jgi:arylsulfatase A-like enzyme
LTKDKKKTKKSIDRRDFITTTVGAGITIALGANFRQIAEASAKGKNILFVSIDDLNDWGGPFGTAYQKVHTPGIDLLSSMGTTFTKAYCAAPACGPSRNSLMTGVHPLNMPNSGWEPFYTYTSRENSIPKIFKDSGYHVMGGGKLFHGHHNHKDPKIPWEDSTNDPGVWNEYFKTPDDPTIHPKVNGPEGNGHFVYGAHYPGKEEDMPDRKTLKWAKDKLAANYTKPFFLGVGFYRPHLPWLVPQKYFDLYPLDKIVKPDVPFHDLDDVPEKARDRSGGRDHKRMLRGDEWKKAIQGYLASITFADNCLYELIQTLNASKYKNDTLIVLWTDHGWHLGEKLGWRKFKLWERATKVPLVFAGPGVAKNVKNENVVSLMDVKPTITDMLLNNKKPAQFGESMKSILSTPSRKEDRSAVTAMSEDSEGKLKAYSVRNARWRYIEHSDGTAELYDHDADPKEHINLLARENSRNHLQSIVRMLKSKAGK